MTKDLAELRNERQNLETSLNDFPESIKTIFSQANFKEALLRCEQHLEILNCSIVNYKETIEEIKRNPSQMPGYKPNNPFYVSGIIDIYNNSITKNWENVYSTERMIGNLDKILKISQK